MKVTRRFILWATMLCLLGMIGCSRETPIGKVAQDDKGGRELSKLQEVQTELTNLANRVHACNVPSYDYVASLRKKLSEMSPSERETAFGCVEDVFSRPRLRQFPLSQRENSMLAYSSIVLKLTNLFSEEMENSERVWLFLLRIIAVFDSDRVIVSAPSFDPHTPLFGLHITKGMYADAMDAEKFEAIQKGFEQNIFFVRYYHRLSAEQQKEWIARLRKAAGRKVVIYDPGNPGRETPKRPLTIPSHLPPQVQEQYREIRRNALKKAGIDPSVEGL